MIKYSLVCKDCELAFESWFASSIEYEKLKKKKLLNCHRCNSINIQKNLMAPNLINKKSNNELHDDKKLAKLNNIKKTINEYQKFIKNNFEYVGEKFTYEARSIHYNEKKNKKGIYGTASKQDLKELKDEGIETYSIPWINDENNRKPDGSKYNLNTDGLKIYTTINYSMQEMAENAVLTHMPRLQKEFFEQNETLDDSIAPFRELTSGAVDTLLRISMRRSERWRKMKYDLKKDNEEIEESFFVPKEMTVFSWEGEIDTIMTPLDSMKYYKSFFRPGMMSMDPTNGYIKAWVGGMNYRHFQYDMVKKGKRQIGSTFKPFVYAAAIDQLKLSPCDTFPDSQFCIEKNKFGNVEQWCPKNSGDKYGRTRTLKNALANSVNTVTARLMDRIGPRTVVKLAKDLGIEQRILPVPSIALGTPDLSVYEMVAAYSTFANKGVYTQPVFIERIEDKNGTTLYENKPVTRDVLSEEAAYVTVNLLEGVTKAGSGTRLRTTGADEFNRAYQNVVTGYPYEFTNPIAGKTGTTQNQSDGWFIGMVPNLVTGVWVGAEDRAIHFEDIAYGQGASMALPIWGVYMKSVYQDSTLMISKDSFERPKRLSIELDCNKFVIDSIGSGKTTDQEILDIDF